MQILEESQMFFDLIGFSRQLKPFNQIIFSNFATHFLANILLLIFAFHEANNVFEYMESIHFACASIGFLLSSITIIFIRERLFEFIDIAADIINENFNHSILLKNKKNK